MRIGVLRGDFNPIHKGHIVLCEELMNMAGIRKVIFLPSFGPNAEERLEMIRLTIEGMDYFDVSDIELRAEKAPYTYDSLCKLRDLYPDDKICAICGSDDGECVDRWGKAPELIEEFSFVAGFRPGTDERTFLHNVALTHMVYEHLKYEYYSTKALDISSSEIRALASYGSDISSMVVPKVAQYIKEHNLYV